MWHATVAPHIPCTARGDRQHNTEARHSRNACIAAKCSARRRAQQQKQQQQRTRPRLRPKCCKHRKEADCLTGCACTGRQQTASLCLAQSLLRMGHPWLLRLLHGPLPLR